MDRAREPLGREFPEKHFEKMDKYNKLAIDLREGKHHGVKWTVELDVQTSQLQQMFKASVDPGVPRCCSSL